MEYKDIGSLLANLKAALVSTKRKKEVVIQAVFKNTGALLQETDISWTGTTAYVTGSGVFKSELALKKAEILACIREASISITDIR